MPMAGGEMACRLVFGSNGLTSANVSPPADVLVNTPSGGGYRRRERR